MYDLSSYNLGEMIKNIRKSKDIPLEKLGDKIGKTKGTIYKYEDGTIIPDFITVMEICNALDINVNQLCNFENCEKDDTRSINPFKTDKLYLYYISFSKKLIVSFIEVKSVNGVHKAVFNNLIRKNSNECAFRYVGSLESDNIMAYINLRNDGTTNQKFEKVQITLSLRYAVDNKYIGSITGVTEGNEITNRKCMLTTDLLVDKDELDDCFEKLLIKEEEIDSIKIFNFWNIKTDNSQEYAVNE